MRCKIGEGDVSIIRRWRINIYSDHGEDGILYIDAKELDVSAEIAEHFVGDQDAAFAEANRRADLWESRTGGFVTMIECESRGVEP